MEGNKKTYSNEKVVAYYYKYEGLQKPEQTIFNFLKDKLSQMKMLDIGIGVGRTTAHFAPSVREYTGIDYAIGMVEACKKKFSGRFPKIIFKEADVRKLDTFNENYFDLVLFSFNGIDYISDKERILSFKEIYRVLEPGGYFCFSTHNIQSLSDSSKLKFRLNLFALLKQFIVWRKVKKINKLQFEKIKTSDFVCINDGAHDFGLQTHYFRPLIQEKILLQAGFTNIRFFSLNSGLEIFREEIDHSTDSWIYYLCQKN